MTTTATNQELVDRAGKLKAQAAQIAEELDEIKTTLIERHVKAVEGRLFRATLSNSTRETLDDTGKAKMKELYLAGTSPQFRTAHTVESVSVTMRVVARTGRDLQENAA